MKKILFLLTFTLIFFSGNAQLKNVNPDPHGEPWYIGGLRIPSKAELAKIPTVQLAENAALKNAIILPSTHDNTTQPYFRPIFNQSDGSCSQSSGVAYNFTYEINRERGTDASLSVNQFPSHYTYNFLNDGDGNNGSWYTDGWDIIKANGCPNIPTYGGDLDSGGPKKWMSGYNNYESGMNNRVKEYFAIDVSTPAGLETLKHWMYDHLEGAATGSLVNFAAGISNNGFNMTSNNIVTSWGYVSNHAMTFVGWNDNITYDYNNDGQITNNIDINNDGVVDMRDWERGALIMVNSWGTYWGNNGKAYVMYKILAEDMAHGGIVGKKVFAVRVKNTQEPQLKMRVKMRHNSRKRIKISAGIASADLTSAIPEHKIDFPLFNKQGGDFDMQGINSNPIEITLDITPLLSFVDPNTQAKFFLIVNEDDPNGTASGMIYDFAIVDNNDQVYTCAQHNVNLLNNDDTILSITTGVSFNSPEITTNSLPGAIVNTPYSYDLQATGGSPAYIWKVLQHYNEQTHSDAFPAITGNPVTTTSDDDGYGTQNIDFDFPFYGSYYNQLYISTDGSIIFEPNFTYLRTESAIKANKVISPFASDLMIYPADGDGIFYEGDANHATFRWKTSLYGDQSANVDVAVTLYPNGNIKFYYGNNITPDLTWAAGISNGNGSAVILSNSGISTPDNDKFELVPQSYPTGMDITLEGTFHGTAPNEVNTWDIDFQVTDNNNVSKVKTLTFSTSTNAIKTQNLYKLQCYPNPVTETAIFSYQLKNDQNVHLVIYDLAGKPVQQIINEHQNAGKYQIYWSPNMAKGVYIYQLTTQQGSQTGKIIVK